MEYDKLEMKCLQRIISTLMYIVKCIGKNNLLYSTICIVLLIISQFRYTMDMISKM